MQGGDQRGQLIFRNVLQLIDEDRRRCACGLRGFSNAAHEIGEIGFKVAAIRQARFRVELHGKLDVAVARLQFDEACQGAEGALDAFAGRSQAVHSHQCGAERGRQDGRQGPVLRCFDHDNRDAFGFCRKADLVEQHGFADPAQPVQDTTLGRSAVGYPVQSYRYLFSEAVTPGQFRRRGAGSRGERVPAWVHIASLYQFMDWR